MDPLNPLGRIGALLRRQIADRTRSVEGGGRLGASSGSAGRAVGESTEQRVMARLAALDLQEPGFTGRASRVFLDEVLGEEFGEAVLATPEFQTLVDDLQAVWATDKDLGAALKDLARQARAGQRSSPKA